MIVYLITNLANGKVYVGKTMATLETRWSEHKCRARQLLNMSLYKAIREEGSENFDLKVLHEVQPNEDGDALEQHWIKQYRSNDPEFGYNMTAGGKGLVEPSEETRRRIGLGALGRPQTDKQKQAVSLAMKGKPKPLEQRIKMAAHWDEQRRDEQAEIARRTNAVENLKLNDYVCGNCGKQFTQVKKGVFGGHRKYCLKTIRVVPQGTTATAAP